MPKSAQVKLWFSLKVSFPHLLTLTQKEKKLNPKAKITYKRPTRIGQKPTNYKDLALHKTRKQTKGGSRPCEHCALCGCYGKNNKSMVPNASQLLTKTKTFKLNQSLTCADFGIYVTTCVICHEQYVGQTSNKFSKRNFPHMAYYFSLPLLVISPRVSFSWRNFSAISIN